LKSTKILIHFSLLFN